MSRLRVDDTPSTTSNKRATHFEVGPTILDAAGFADQYKIGAGVSLFSGSSKNPGSGQAKHKNVNAPSLLKTVASVKEIGITISLRDLSLAVGELTLKANNSGQKFVSGMYLAVLDEKGNVIDAIYSDDYESLARNLDGTFVIGLSVMPDKPKSESHFSESYFYGVISPDGSGITQRALNHDVHLGAADLWPQQD